MFFLSDNPLDSYRLGNDHPKAAAQETQSLAIPPPDWSLAGPGKVLEFFFKTFLPLSERHVLF